MKRKIKIRPLKIKRVYLGEGGRGMDHQDLLEGYWDMGYTIYEDPTNENCVIISSIRLTYQYLWDHAGLFQIDKGWWKDDTDFNDRLDEELDEENP